jgi:hypothetical protein
VVVALVVFGSGGLDGKGMLWRDCSFSLLGSCAIFGLVMGKRIRLVELALDVKVILTHPV